MPGRKTAPAQERGGRLLGLEDEIIELFVDLASILGLPRSYGEIYGLLYASVRPLSFTDIHDRLKLSKGSVSQGLKALHRVGAIRPAEGDDPRREHFVAEVELRRLIAGFLNGSIHAQLRQGIGRLHTINLQYRDVLSADDGSGRALRSRVERLQSWYAKGHASLPFIARIVG